jgi:hypothetical protein
VLRPERRYQALRLWRTAARLDSGTAAELLASKPFDGAVDRVEWAKAAHGICRGSVAAAAASSAMTSTCM